MATEIRTWQIVEGKLTRIMQQPSLPKMRGGRHTDVILYFKCLATKQIWQTWLPLVASNTEQFLAPVECTFWVNIPNWTIHHNLLIFLFVPYCSVFEVHNSGLSTIFLGQQVPETVPISCSLKLPSPKCRKEKQSLHFRMKKLRTSDSKLRGKGDG